MQIIPRQELAFWLRAAGLEPETREFPEVPGAHRLTVREREQQLFTGGPHRKVVYSDGRVEGPFAVADRPALSGFVADVFEALGVERVLAVVTEGTFWLNNKAQSAYLWRVADAQEVARFLRARGLTDRFQGGFLVNRSRFEAVLPRLAANTFSGGGDVLFASVSPSCHLTVLACHHFDLHFSTPQPELLDDISALASRNGLEADTLALPELPEISELWT